MGGSVPISPGLGRQTEIKDKVGPGREQKGCKGLFPNSLKKEAHCCSEQKGEATCSELLGKEERLRIGGKKSFQSQHMRDYSSSLLSRLIMPKGSTEALKVMGDLHSWAIGTVKEV
jgi:hypothetical protein